MKRPKLKIKRLVHILPISYNKMFYMSSRKNFAANIKFERETWPAAYAGSNS